MLPYSSTVMTSCAFQCRRSRLLNPRRRPPGASGRGMSSGASSPARPGSLPATPRASRVFPPSPPPEPMRLSRSSALFPVGVPEEPPAPAPMPLPSFLPSFLPLCRDDPSSSPFVPFSAHGAAFTGRRSCRERVRKRTGSETGSRDVADGVVVDAVGLEPARPHPCAPVEDAHVRIAGARLQEVRSTPASSPRCRRERGRSRPSEGASQRRPP